MKSLLLILSTPRYFGPAWAFASLNLLFGTWAIYIPTVKADLQIDKASLGIALFCLSLGVFTVFPVASKIINKMGVGRATNYSVWICCIAALFPLLAPNYYLLMGALFVFGFTNGLLDIAMNTILFYKQYVQIIAAPIRKEPFSIKLFKPLFILGLISFVVMGSEGAIVDWSGLYLQEVSMAPETLIGLGFLAFSLLMTLGRFLGDSISATLGSIKIVIIGCTIAIGGYLLVLTTATYLAIAGFALTGLGFSVIIPELFRIGGNVLACAIVALIAAIFLSRKKA